MIAKTLDHLFNGNKDKLDYEIPIIRLNHLDKKEFTLVETGI